MKGFFARTKFTRLSAIAALTALAICVVTLILGAAEDRSAVARFAPMGFSLAPASSQSTPPYEISLKLIANGLSQLAQITHADDESGRLFVVERTGAIYVITTGLMLTPFLDLQSIVESASNWERGLFSVAFDPDYKTNGTFYVDYTASITGHVGDIVVARYQVSDPDANVAHVLTVTNILTIVHPQVMHNGGQLQFGPNDNDLYVSVGDAGLPAMAQSLTTTLGKILRIDVRGMPTYTIPNSNPFTQTIGARPEIWASGLRNPWRFSFDRSNGDMYIGDVGQDCFEEIDYQPASSHGGKNYGWPLMEGRHYFDPINGGCNQPLVASNVWITLTRPITNYYHGVDDSIGSAVSGGYVYRGSQYPWLAGIYFFADFGSGRVWSEQLVSPGVWSSAHLLDTSINLTSFGDDQAGELYVAGFGGAVYKIVSTRADLAASSKQASNRAPRFGHVLTYSIVLRNSANLITNTICVTDVIPIGLSYLADSFAATHGSVEDSAAPILIWTGEMSNTPVLTLTYAVTVSTVDTQVVTNAAIIDPGFTAPFTRTAAIIVNGLRVYLPLILKNR